MADANFWVLYKRTRAQEGWSRWPFYKDWHVLYRQPFRSAEDAQDYIRKYHRSKTVETCVLPGESEWTKEHMKRRFV